MLRPQGPQGSGMALATLGQVKLLQVNYMDLPHQAWIQGLVSLRTSRTNTGQCRTSPGRVGDGEKDQEHPADTWPHLFFVNRRMHVA